ncbi:unnamed protein product [Didymodactylos carnosus]|uniref:Uncharacterized protein n=1 Tax=Didymodactylos carnosus TaxID=1234261 RepID=A0A814Y7P2_9BILA|nr:unnamed protein product [Didymodactylos carnosus]CAF3988678.1 unnamed protein product [Didymodactylos carnosus]
MQHVLPAYSSEHDARNKNNSSTRAIVDLSKRENNLSNVEMTNDGSDVSSSNPIPMQTRQARRKPTPVLEFAKRLDQTEFLCLLCDKTYKDDVGSTTNIRKYLGSKHGKVHLIYKSTFQLSKRVRAFNKSALDKAAIKCIIRDGRSFNDFKKSGMQTFFREATLNYYGPSSRAVKRHLHALHMDERNKLKDELCSIDNMLLIYDLWFSSRRSYYGCVIVHFMVKDFTIKSAVLSFRRFLGQHYSKRSNSHLNRVIQQYDLQNKIISITTDNGSNMKLTGFDSHIYCCAHALNLTFQKSLCLWPQKQQKNAENQNNETSGCEEDETDTPDLNSTNESQNSSDSDEGDYSDTDNDEQQSDEDKQIDNHDKPCGAPEIAHSTLNPITKMQILMRKCSVPAATTLPLPKMAIKRSSTQGAAVTQEISIYVGLSKADYDLSTFWLEHEQRLPILSYIAKKFLQRFL